MPVISISCLEVDQVLVYWQWVTFIGWGQCCEFPSKFCCWRLCGRKGIWLV